MTTERWAQALNLAIKAKIARRVADRLNDMADEAWQLGQLDRYTHIVKSHARADEIAGNALREAARLGY